MAKKKQELSPEERLAAALVPEEEQPYELPEGWKWVYWGKCGEFIAGTGFPKAYQGLTDRKYPFYKVGSLRYVDADGCLTDNQHTIDDDVLIKLKAKKVGPHAIVFAKIGEAIRLNRRGLTKQDCCIDNNMMAFQADKDLLSYQYAYFWSLGLDLYKYTNATTVPAIRKTDLEKITFPLPSLYEQRRIITHIESMFAKLDAAKEKVQSVLDAHETRKAALLHDAFMGKLTAKWRKEHGVMSDSWYTDTLKNLCEKITDGTHHSPPNSDKGDYMYVTAKNIKETGIDLDNITYVSSAVHEEIYKRCDVQTGDVLYIKDGATTGIATVNTLDEPFSLLSSVAVLRPHEERLLSGYLKHLLNSSEQKSKMLNNMSGNAITRLTLSKLKATSIRVCSLSEQRQIVDILDRLLDREEKVRQSAESVLESIDRMKQSILARTFRGEL